jgi:hypothetical protein
MLNKGRQARLLLILGGMAAIGPFAVDMYLPGFSAIARDLKSDVAHVAFGTFVSPRSSLPISRLGHKDGDFRPATSTSPTPNAALPAFQHSVKRFASRLS